MYFASDNSSGFSPEMLKALEDAGPGYEVAYGDDRVTAQLNGLFSELFETDLAVYPVISGTAANGLALAVTCPPYGVVYCHREAHINVHECGGVEFFSGGARIEVLDGAGARITASGLEQAVNAPLTGVHSPQPAAVSISQTSETGAVYTAQEVTAICGVAHDRGLSVHMDGARLANAVAALDCRPADITWKAGVDTLAFGATKNGALAAESVIFFDPDRAGDFEFRRKRAGHLVSKMRFVSAQWRAYFHNDLWLTNARHANAMGAALAEGLGRLPGVSFAHPPETNMVFATFPEGVLPALAEAGAQFYYEADGSRTTARLVTSFSTTADDVREFVDLAAGQARKGA